MAIIPNKTPSLPYSVATASPVVVVVPSVCDRLATLLATRKGDVPEDREDSQLPGFSGALIGNFYFLLVAICHQTSPRGHAPLEGKVNGVYRRGWDYLSARLEEAARDDQAILAPATWRGMSCATVRSMFRDAEYGERLSEPDLRTELINDLGDNMIRHNWTTVLELYGECEGRVATGTPNLLDTLGQFRAYRDPVRKKSVFFLALMRNSGLWHYPDEELLGPPVDYHEVRGHLRLGTVQVIDLKLTEKLRSGVMVTADEDVQIRQAVYDAIMLISERSGLRNPSRLHYLFWNVFRSVCTRHEPHCFAIGSESLLPTRYKPITNFDGQHRCPFSEFCSSAGKTEPICEHVFETDYY